MEPETRIGLYICHCGLNIAGVISPEALTTQGQELPEVAVCRHHLYTCSEAGQAEILKDIKHFNLNRVVIAACSPKLHEVTFRRLLVEAGLNPYLLELVNIREQCTWVHAGEPEAAQEKALELIRMGLAKARLALPLEDRRMPLTRHALVIGGGPAGLRAALDIANVGFPVTLVERQPILGGMANRLHHTFPRGESALSLINPLMAAVALHPGIEVLTRSEVTEVSGHLGEFAVTVRQRRALVGEACDRCGRCAEVCPVEVPDPEGLGTRAAIHLPAPQAFPGRYVVDLEHCTRCGECVPVCPQEAINLEEREEEHQLTVGSMVVATGFSPFDPTGSRYEPWAALRGVITTVTLERLLSPAGPTQGSLVLPETREEPRDVAFVLCVGSREEEGNRYCSRVCCPTALKQALELRKILPEARIRIYYRDIRTTKKDWEVFYNRARNAGILFLRGKVEDIKAAPDGRVVIQAYDETFQRPSEDRVDLAVLAVGMVPGNGTPLREVLKLPVGPDGFFLEAHPKLKPVETVLDGIFLAAGRIPDPGERRRGQGPGPVRPRDHHPGRPGGPGEPGDLRGLRGVCRGLSFPGHGNDRGGEKAKSSGHYRGLQGLRGVRRGLSHRRGHPGGIYRRHDPGPDRRGPGRGPGTESPGLLLQLVLLRGCGFRWGIPAGLSASGQNYPHPVRRAAAPQVHPARL